VPHEYFGNRETIGESPHFGLIECLLDLLSAGYSREVDESARKRGDRDAIHDRDFVLPQGRPVNANA
jgi:hypothetical protein